MRYLIIFLSIFGFVLPVLAAETVDVSVFNWNGTPAARGIEFPTAGATVGNPWVRSPQYLRVEYSCDTEDIWGIRIITRNKSAGAFAGMAPKILGIGSGADGVRGTADDTWRPGPDGVWGTADDVWGYGTDGIPGTNDDTVHTSFGGLIDSATKNNPDYRADIAWQIFRDPVPEPDEIYRNWRGVWNVGGNWNDDWAYVVDWDNWWNGQRAVGGIFYPGTWDARYEMAITGNAVVNYLAQHPVVSGSKSRPDPKPGDGDVAIYLAACFGIAQNGQFISLLAAGDYYTVLYVELIANE